MKVELKHLSLEMGESEFNMLQGIANGENGFYNPAYHISYAEYREWLKKEDDMSKGVGLPEGWVPAHRIVCAFQIPQTQCPRRARHQLLRCMGSHLYP